MAEPTTPLMTSPEPPLEKPGIRVENDQRIEKAAEITGKSVSDFVRDAALSEADAVIEEQSCKNEWDPLDQKVLCLNKENWDALQERLNGPPKDYPALRELMARKPQWESNARKRAESKPAERCDSNICGVRKRNGCGRWLLFPCCQFRETRGCTRAHEAQYAESVAFGVVGWNRG